MTGGGGGPWGLCPVTVQVSLQWHLLDNTLESETPCHILYEFHPSSSVPYVRGFKEDQRH